MPKIKQRLYPNSNCTVNVDYSILIEKKDSITIIIQLIIYRFVVISKKGIKSNGEGNYDASRTNLSK